MIRAGGRLASSPLQDLKLLLANRSFNTEGIRQSIAVTTTLPDLNLGSAPATGSSAEDDSTVSTSGRYEIQSLNAIPREKRGLKRHRQAGYLPGMLSLVGEQVELILLDAKQINRLVNDFGMFGIQSRLFNLRHQKNDGQEEEYPVIVKNLHRTASTDALENVVLMHCPPTRRVNVNVPIKLTGESVSPGVRKGGFISITRWFVRCSSLGGYVPSHFLVDVSKMDMGDKYGLNILEDLPYGLFVNEKHTSDPICRMVGKERAAASA